MGEKNTVNFGATPYANAAPAGFGNWFASPPSTLDTLAEFATALGNDPAFATTMTNALALKAPLASPVFTGDPRAPTPTPGDNDTSLATTAFVATAVAANGRPNGQCVLTWGSSTLLNCFPKNGNKLIINDIVQTVPPVGTLQLAY
jgi:hypothetical protein